MIGEAINNAMMISNRLERRNFGHQQLISGPRVHEVFNSFSKFPPSLIHFCRLDLKNAVTVAAPEFCTS